MSDDKCRKCGGEMKPGKAMGQTAVARRPARDAHDVRTFYAGGTGKLIDCLKCSACGWSVSASSPSKEMKSE